MADKKDLPASGPAYPTGKQEKNTTIGSVKGREIVQEMKESYIDYAMSVIVARALPDVRDGLKPVHRRILYAMLEEGLRHSAKFRKSATVVGSVLGRYHPHGDVAVYESMVRMAQDFSLRYPLIEGQGNWGCFTKDTEVRLADGRNLSFGDLIKEQKQGKRHWTFSFNSKEKKIEIVEIKKPRLTKKSEKIIEVTLDNGEKIKCTPNHRFMLREGLYKEAQFLNFGESLMPLYTSFYNGEDKNLRSYEMIFQPSAGIWSFVHRLADAWNIENGIYKKSAGKVRHHKDLNKLNNNPDNIVRMQWKDHWALHYNLTSQKHKNDPVYREKLSEGRRKYWSDPEKRKASGEQIKAWNIENWKKESYREKMRVFLSEVNKKYLKAHPEVVERIRERARVTMKRLWQIPEYKNLFHEKIVASNKRRKTNLTGKRKFLNICKYLKNNEVVLDKENYEKIRIEVFGGKNFTSWDLGFNKYYNNNSERLIAEVNNNHKVVRIRSLRKKEDVYDLTVDKWHNFSLASGIFVHNSIDGDGAAAMRYTECRLSVIGEEMLRDIEKETVQFIDNYDGTHKEPQVLPSPVPQLLLNGSLGIAVGMATSIPPHNLTELIDALLYILDEPKAETEDLFQFVQGPDFPTGGIIYDQKEIITAYSQGKGAIVIRGKADIIEKGDNTQIIITEIPYQVSKADLVLEMANLVSEKKVEGIKDIRDLSDREGMRIMIDIKRGFQPQRVLNRLYKFTNLQKTFYLNLLALVDGIQPNILSLADVLKYFLTYRKEVLVKRTQYDLSRAKDRAHILEGLVIALNKIDAVINTIKKSKDKDEAKINLIKKFKLTEKQAVAILEMKLQTLAGLERKKIEDELKEVLAIIKELTAILKSPERLKALIKKELQETKEKYGDKRRTKVVKQKLGEITEIDLVPLEETVITLTRGGYIKRINPTTYKIQKRGGKGMVGMKTMGDDIVEHFLSASTHDNLMFFTDSGKLFQTQAYEIPEGTRVARGRGLLNFLELSTEEKVLELLPIKKEEAGKYKYLVMVTNGGKIKKTSLEDFANVRKSGIIAIKLMKGDLLRKVVKTTGEDEIILTTKKGISIRFKEKDIRPMGRAAAGVKGISLKKGDEVIGMDVVESEKNKEKSEKPIKRYLLAVMENGYGKRTDINQYRAQGRGGSGIKTAQITPKTGELIMAKVLAGDEEDLIVVSQKGNVIRTMVSSISILGRATQGVRIMRLDEGDKVASGACI